MRNKMCWPCQFNRRQGEKTILRGGSGRGKSSVANQNRPRSRRIWPEAIRNQEGQNLAGGPHVLVAPSEGTWGQLADLSRDYKKESA